MYHTVLFYLNTIIAQTPTPPTTDQVDSGFGYVIAAFTAIWLMIAGYIFWLNRRQDNLRKEVAILRQEEADRQQGVSNAQARYNESDLSNSRSQTLGG